MALQTHRRAYREFAERLLDMVPDSGLVLATLAVVKVGGRRPGEFVALDDGVLIAFRELNIDVHELGMASTGSKRPVELISVAEDGRSVRVHPDVQANDREFWSKMYVLFNDVDVHYCEQPLTWLASEIRLQNFDVFGCEDEEFVALSLSSSNVGANVLLKITFSDLADDLRAAS